jgi:hypothetical protein
MLSQFFSFLFRQRHMIFLHRGFPLPPFLSQESAFGAA